MVEICRDSLTAMILGLVFLFVFCVVAMIFLILVIRESDKFEDELIKYKKLYKKERDKNDTLWIELLTKEEKPKKRAKK